MFCVIRMLAKMIIANYLEWQQFVRYISCNKIPKWKLPFCSCISRSSGSHIISFYLFTIHVPELKTDRAHVFIRDATHAHTHSNLSIYGSISLSSARVTYLAPVRSVIFHTHTHTHTSHTTF